MSDINPIAEGAKSVSSGLKSAREAGKELTKTIETSQRDAVDVALEKDFERRRQARDKEDKESLLIYKAIQEYERLNGILKLEEKAEADFVNKYGKKEWTKVVELKALVDKEEKEFKREFDKDLNKVRRVQFWCLFAAAWVTYWLWVNKMI
jgi:hypothetical protein